MPRLSGPGIGMVQTTENWTSDHSPRRRHHCLGSGRHRYPLVQALMRTFGVEILDVGSQHPSQMPLAPNQDPVQTLAAYRADKPLTYRVGTRSLQRCGEGLNVSADGNVGKVDAVFV